MATTERLAKQLVWTNSESQAGEIASLRGSISSGQVVRAVDLNRISTLINNMNGHYHTYDDAFQLATFGNTNATNTNNRKNYFQDKNTNSINSTTSAPTNTVADTNITALRHNELRVAINDLRVHFHGINDRTAI
jgi:hypothetical protein